MIDGYVPLRIRNWRNFSKHMEEYIGKRTITKYGVSKEFDLLSIMGDSRICLFMIIKYAIRLWNGKGKEHDAEKIGHYSEILWNMLQKEKIENEKKLQAKIEAIREE